MMVGGHSPSPCLGKQRKEHDSSRTTERKEEDMRRTKKDKRMREGKHREHTKRIKEGQTAREHAKRRTRRVKKDNKQAVEEHEDDRAEKIVTREEGEGVRTGLAGTSCKAKAKCPQIGQQLQNDSLLPHESELGTCSSSRNGAIRARDKKR